MTAQRAYSPKRWNPPPLPTNPQHRTPIGLPIPFPDRGFQKRMAKVILRRLLPPPVQIVLEIIDWMYPKNDINVPANWATHCVRVPDACNGIPAGICATTFGPGCLTPTCACGAGGATCNCLNTGQSFPGSVWSAASRAMYVYTPNPPGVCGRLARAYTRTDCPSGTPGSTRPYWQRPRPSGFQPYQRPHNPTRAPNRYVPRRNPGWQKPHPNWKPDPGRKDLPEHQPMPEPKPPEPPPPYVPRPRPERPPYIHPREPEVPAEWQGPIPWFIPQFIPPLMPGFDNPQGVPYPDIPNQPDHLPFPGNEWSERGNDLPGQFDDPDFWDWSTPGGLPGPAFLPARPRPGLPGWPRVRVDPRPGSRPAPPGTRPATRPATAPPQINRPHTFNLPRVQVRLEPRQPGVPKRPTRPGGRVKEAKFVLAIGAASRIGRAVNIFTEGADLVECLHKGLPTRLQSKPKWHKVDDGWERNKSISLKTKAMDLYRSIDARLTPVEATKALGISLMECIDNWAEDRIIGAIGKKMAQASRRRGLMHGYEIGGSARRAAGKHNLRLPR